MVIKDFQEVVHNYLDVFRQGERYFDGDQKRMAYFRKNPLNEDTSEIVVKISTMEHDHIDDRVYSRQIMADHIASLHIDERLQQGAPDIVDAIAHLEVRGNTYFLYGFASRYCNWHNLGEYPIYDLTMRRLLAFFWQEVMQRPLLADDFYQYARFKRWMLAFRSQVMMEGYNFKELDTFIWIYGDKILRDITHKKQLAHL